jgi:hypothetical protein
MERYTPEQIHHEIATQVRDDKPRNAVASALSKTPNERVALLIAMTVILIALLGTGARAVNRDSEPIILEPIVKAEECTTRFWMQNVGSESTAITCVFKDEGGQTIMLLHSPFIPPGEIKIIDMAYQGPIPTGYVGWVEISADQPIAAEIEPPKCETSKTFLHGVMKEWGDNVCTSVVQITLELGEHSATSTSVEFYTEEGEALLMLFDPAQTGNWVIDLGIIENLPSGYKGYIKVRVNPGVSVEAEIIEQRCEITPTPTSTSTPTVTSTPTSTSTSTPYRVYLPLVLKNYTPFPVASTTIDPGEDGELTSPDGRVQLDFPAGAVSESTVVAYTQRTTPSQSSGSLAFAGTSFDIWATDTNGNPVINFSQTFNMTIAYADADWQNAGITDETTLNVYWWDGTAWNGLLPCTDCSHNTDSNEFVISLNHLTEFALLGVKPPTPTPTNTPTPTITPTPVAVYEGNQITLDPVARMWDGCSTAFWVKPLDGGPIFVIADFLTLEGDEILFVGNWVDSGSWFDLEDIVDLRSGYCGRAVIETHDSIVYPGPPFYEPVRVEVMTACDCP